MSDHSKKSANFKRKYHLKSRSGCSTCKKRRVKCDESKPLCNNCVRMKLVCGYVDHPDDDDARGEKRARTERTLVSAPVQQTTPTKTPSPHMKPEPLLPSMASALSSGLLNAGNLNNINLSHLVNNLSNMGDLSTLGNFSNLNSLAVLAQLPVDLSALGAQMGFSLAPQGLAAAAKPVASAEAEAQAVADAVAEAQAAAEAAPAVSPLEHPPAPKPALPEAPAGLSEMLAGAGLPEALAGAAQMFLGQAPSISPNVSAAPNPVTAPALPANSLNMLDLRLMYHYTTHVSGTITGAGISDTDIWNHDVPMLAFEYPFLMHAILAFSATHLSRTEKGLDQCVTCHRGDALRLLREAILDINSNNTDALVASALILIMDSLANASMPSLTSPKSLPASAWIFHVKGAATILTAVWPLTEALRFYKFISVDLGDLGDIINEKSHLSSVKPSMHANLECHDSDIADLYPVAINSPYLITLAYLNKLHKERYKADFILRIFAFPALLDKDFLGLLMSGDVKAMRIMRSYYKLLRSFTTEMKDKVWFLEGVSQVLPVDVEEYAGGAGGMHMMLDFLGGGPAIVEDHEVDKDLSMLDPGGQIANKLNDTNNLPSDITSNLDVMQGDSGLMGIK